MFGREEGLNALRDSHERIFIEWLGFSLKQKFEDVDNYLAELEEPHKAVNHWLGSKLFNSYVPGEAHSLERDLYMHDLEALLETIKNAAVPGPTA